MDFNSTTITISALLFGVLCWLLNKWLGKRIDSSIQAHYDREKFAWEAEQRRREKVQLVAELLAEWSSHALKPQLTADERMRINRLSYEASLWLPEEISRKLSRVLQNDPSAINPHDLLLEVRRVLSGPHDLLANDVTVWLPHHELPNRGVPQGCMSGIVNVNRAQIEVAGEIGDAQFDSQGVCLVPDNATLHLTFIVGEKTAIATRTGVKSMTCLRRHVDQGSQVALTLRLFPGERADEINLQLYAGTASADKL